MGQKQTKIKFKIVKAHWRKMSDFGFLVEDNSGDWYFIRVIYHDGDKKTYRKPFRTFNEALTVCVEYLSRLRSKNILAEKAESEARSIILRQKERKQKDPSKMVYVAAAITTIIGTPISVGISVYSTLNQNKQSYSASQNKGREKTHLNEKDVDSSKAKSFKNSIGMRFILIQAGTFMMGQHINSEKYIRKDAGILGNTKWEYPQHKVTISKPYYLQSTIVTQGQWNKVIGLENPSNSKKFGYELPVTNISWNNAKKFIKNLNEIEKTDKYRLPTEAEWEYACRAGTTTLFFFGDNADKLGEYACYIDIYDIGSNLPQPVGRKKPNTWGLYDMIGNVGEWVEDDFHDTYIGAPGDGSAWVDKKRTVARVVRGNGSFSARNYRSAYRTAYGADLTILNDVGFRLARSVGP